MLKSIETNEDIITTFVLVWTFFVHKYLSLHRCIDFSQEKMMFK